MATQEVKIIEDSITSNGIRITTFQLRYWRAIHAEVMTHRVFSRNASSSRAIPIKRMLANIRANMAKPTYWGSNKPGMQAGKEIDGSALWMANLIWATAGKAACAAAWALEKLGVHKQIANRLTEPFQYISVVLTSTEWLNFYELRDHPAAMPEFRDLARKMKHEQKISIPKKLKKGDWHLPYITKRERTSLTIEQLVKLSTARCCRVSYDRHDGKPAEREEDYALHDMLVVAEPLHASPAEHQVMFDTAHGNSLSGNLHGRGIVQYRKVLEAHLPLNNVMEEVCK
jgi:hypothetical protein